MKYQSSKSSCGPASLSNALEALGIERTEDELATLSKQDTTGTTSINLRKAAEAVGVEVNNVVIQNAESAAWCVSYHMTAGHPGILVVDNDEHWVALVGHLNGTYIVADSADNDLLLFYSEEQLLERWRNEHCKYNGFFLAV